MEYSDNYLWLPSKSNHFAYLCRDNGACWHRSSWLLYINNSGMQGRLLSRGHIRGRKKQTKRPWDINTNDLSLNGDLLIISVSTRSTSLQHHFPSLRRTVVGFRTNFIVKRINTEKNRCPRRSLGHALKSCKYVNNTIWYHMSIHIYYHILMIVIWVISIIHIHHANMAVSDKTTPIQSFTMHPTNGVGQQALHSSRMRFVLLHFTRQFHSLVVALWCWDIVWHTIDWREHWRSNYHSLNSITVPHGCKQAPYFVLQTVLQAVQNDIDVDIGYRNWPRYGLRWSGWYCYPAQHELCRPPGTTGAVPDCCTNHDSTDRINGQFLFYHDHNFTKCRGNFFNVLYRCSSPSAFT